MADVTAIIDKWPVEAKEAAQLVIDAYGQPDEICDSMIVWNKPGSWKRIIAYKDFDKHDFPAPHIDCIESFIDYVVPSDILSSLNTFDGSVVVNRTRGEISARCHDEQANNLALNLAHDIVAGKKTTQEARNYYAYEFLAYRKKEPTPYMDKLHFEASTSGGDPDTRLLNDEQLSKAVDEGKAKK